MCGGGGGGGEQGRVKYYANAHTVIVNSPHSNDLSK